MARDYVTIREEEKAGKTTWTFNTVSRARLKSAPAKVTVSDGRYKITGVAWGSPVRKVQVRIDDGPWQPTRLRRHFGAHAELAWSFWTYHWPTPPPGSHTVTARAIGEDGTVQPPQDDPVIANRRTYWENSGQITRHVVIPA